MITLAFDMDGTLFDSGDILAGSWQKAAEEFERRNGVEIQVPAADVILTQIGYPADVVFPKLFPYLDTSGTEEMADLCTEAISNDILAGGGLIYQGIPELLGKLKDMGFRMVLASNGYHGYLKAITESKNIDMYFEDEIITIDKNEIKNKNDIVRGYIEKYTDTEKFIMIGDRLSDLTAAKVNGTDFIGCAFGHAGNLEFDGAEHVVHSVDELFDAVMKISGE